MENHGRIKLLLVCSLLITLMILPLPAGAVNGTISVTHRGNGIYFVGDTVIFDGYNSFSNVTLIRMTGPNLPAQGIPIYDLNGEEGHGSIIPGVKAGSWKFAWYMGTVKGIEKLKSGWYSFTVFDKIYPEETASTSIFLKQPDFYFIVTPDPSIPGDYVQLTGTAENGIGNVRLEIADAKGTPIRGYDTTVSNSGYFNVGFHIDQPPGVYTITMTSPSVKTIYQSNLTVRNPATLVETTDTIRIPASGPTDSETQAPVSTSTASNGTGSISVTSNPMGATVFLDSGMIGQTPLKLDPVPSGSHLIEIKAPGYQTYSEQVQVNAGDMIAISPDLSKSPASMPLSVLTVLAGILISLALILATARHRLS